MIKDFFDTTIIKVDPLSSFSLIFMGVILVIFVQNIVFYFNQKDKSYFWYSLYALIILLDQFIINFNLYEYFIRHHSLTVGVSIHNALEWLYNSTYLIFVLSFAGPGLYKNNGSTIIRKIVLFLLFILSILFILDVYIPDLFLVRKGFTFLAVPILSILSIVVIKRLFTLQTATRNYIILGASIFSIFSMIAFLVTFFFDSSVVVSWEIFYLGVFLENIFFSTGLVVKQKVYLKQKNAAQKDLIIQMQENQHLKNKLTERLKEEVEKKKEELILLNKKAEEDRIKKIEMRFEKEMAELRISSMQSQMNPHFIFNSLNSIKLYIIKNDQENAVYYLNKFSKLIRKILSASRERDVSLQEELETLELYVNIENIRFKNSIQFTLNVEEGTNLATIRIPPLVLQPFIENAIWHGLSPKEGLKTLDVIVQKKQDNYVEINIIDNGIGRKKAEELKEKKLHKKKSIGLKLTKERLDTFSKNFKNKYRLKFIDLVEGEEIIGTKVIILLPLK